MDKPKEKEKGKSRNIDHFMEELKHEQEMRERRNQDREHWREGRHGENPTVSVFCSKYNIFFNLSAIAGTKLFASFILLILVFCSTSR